MAIAAIKCAKCGVKLGTVDNLWIQLGDKYLAQVSDVNDHPDLETRSRAMRMGEADTILKGCKLQDIACSSCSALLGTRCVKSPSNHVLYDGQYIFLVKSVAIKSTVDGRRRVEPKIRHSLSWTVDTTTADADVPGSPSASDQSSPASDQSSPIRDPSSTVRDQSPPGDQSSPPRDPSPPPADQPSEPSSHQKPQTEASALETADDTQREFVLDSEVASAFRSVLSYFERELDKVHGDIRAVRRVGEKQRKKQDAAVQDELSKTKAELDELKEGNLRLREELVKTRQIAREAGETAKELASELSLLKGDIGQLRTDLDRRNVFQFAGRTHMKRSSLLRDGDDDSTSNPPKRVAITPEFASSGGSQHSSPTASAIKRNGLLSRPARRSSGIFGETKVEDEEAKKDEEATEAKDN
ncbi:hypothetical protein BGZ61DRAFT_525104 [Ilyonectria robusta]|uniref:uncharacterized protein n=1 Tax=Ilyonectria robusta TaxID=1079257 RepID=UPI001E8EAF32|nr:uncharacterized protein BGZ61DRAFT_525104 [Ilyonectria robusta]KAH8736884.1 hypothetical protein BGZ61DRAFT_525104 [Ilyonectria robusta]